MNIDLVTEFIKLASMPSPSGKEKSVAEYIKGRLVSFGIESHFDDAGEKVDSDCGNLIAKIGEGDPVLLLVAHMDTVEDGKQRIAPIVKDGIIRSDGTTILGSDDKSAIAALFGAMDELKGEKGLPGTMIAFSIREEAGVTMGAKHLDIPKSVKFAFDLDGSEAPGAFINRAMGYHGFVIDIKGKPAHAAKDPEKGRNAIKAAGMIISQLELGRSSDGRTINIGTIAGGNKDNIVPDSAKLSGEARAFGLEGMATNIGLIKKAAEAACNATGCEFAITMKEQSPPMNTNEDNAIVRLAKAAAEGAGTEFKLIPLYATVQGAYLAEKGFPTLNMARGGRMPHSFDEYISVEELQKAKDVIVQLIKNAASIS